MTKRIISGIATSSATDQVNDQVLPQGGTWNLPLPLLNAHKHDQCVGKVVKLERVGNGILATCELLPAGASYLADHVWATIEHKGVCSFSIGFKAIDGKPNAQGGTTFSKWAMHELSVVPVPCNPECRIIAVQGASAAPAKPATVKPKAATPKPGATVTTKAVRIPLILMSGHEDAAQRQAIDAHNAKAMAHNKLHGLGA